MGWGFSRVAAEDRDEHVLTVPLVASWSIGTDPVLMHTWIGGNLELQLEGQLLVNTEPSTGLAGIGAFTLRHNFLRLDPIFPFFEGGFGLVGLDFDLAQSDGFNLLIQTGAGAHYRFSERWALTLQYRFHHISNARMRLPNPGINTHYFMLGPTFFLR